MRFRHLFLLPPLALVLASTAFGGCNKEEELDNLCLFLKDESSCYRDFLAEIGEQCTMEADVMVNGMAQPLTGTFETYDTLEKCTVTSSNTAPNIVTQVTFDPPIELTKLPYTAGSVQLLINGTPCGTIEFGPNDKLSVALDVYPVLLDPEATCSEVGEQFCGASFSNTPIAAESENDSATLLSTKCEDGSTFKFDRFQVAQQCSDQEGFIPKAKLVIVPNGVLMADGTGKEGSVQLSIKYSPTQELTYVNCKILPALPPCANGVKDGIETDVDCGGNGTCDRCQKDQACIIDSDCAAKKCDVVSGIKKCIE